MSDTSHYREDEHQDNLSVPESRPDEREGSVSLPASAYDDIMNRLVLLEKRAAETVAENHKLHQQIALMKGEDEQIATKMIQVTAGIYSFDIEIPEEKEDELRKGLQITLRVGVNALKSFPPGLTDAMETESRVMVANQESLSYFDKLPTLTRDVIWQKPDSFTLSGFTIHSAAELMSVVIKDAGEDNYSFFQNLAGYECVVTAGALFTRVMLLSGWRNNFNLEQRAIQKIVQPVQPRRDTSNHNDRSGKRSFGRTIRTETAKFDREEEREERVICIPRRPETPPVSSRLYFDHAVGDALENA
jgi:hypothetical protein